MKSKYLYLNFLILILLFSCQKSKEFSFKDDENALSEFKKAWEDNSKTDRTQNTNLMTEDGILIRGGVIYMGEDDVKSFLSKQQGEVKFIKTELKELKRWSSKDFYMSVANRTITYIELSGDTITTSVPAVNIFERQPDGSFKLAMSMKDSSGN